jgi:hypothetical protein
MRQSAHLVEWIGDLTIHPFDAGVVFANPRLQIDYDYFSETFPISVIPTVWRFRV